MIIRFFIGVTTLIIGESNGMICFRLRYLCNFLFINSSLIAHKHDSAIFCCTQLVLRMFYPTADVIFLSFIYISRECINATHQSCDTSIMICFGSFKRLLFFTHPIIMNSTFRLCSIGSKFAVCDWKKAIRCSRLAQRPLSIGKLGLVIFSVNTTSVLFCTFGIVDILLANRYFRGTLLLSNLLVDDCTNCTQPILEIGQAFTNQRDLTSIINLGEYAFIGRFVIVSVRLLKLKFSSRCFGIRVELITYFGFVHNALIFPYLCRTC
mmetsp:Transcript_35195/g.61805  ORF Transcript_35195/g.61805 Transcript_35195/m.61805 type:complete len:266 (+) Transcript_35195:223-1020(+)